MSLLMKALEKAAKDRGEARNEPAAVAAPAPPGKPELALEPIAAPAPASAVPAAPAAPEAAPRARTPQGPRAAAPSAAAREQAQAGTVLQAQSARRPSRGAASYLRDHPVMVAGTLAGVAAIGFGIYVYLQIFHPSLFVRGPTAFKAPPPPPSVAAPAPPVAAVPAPLPSAPLLKEAAAEPAPPVAQAAPKPAPPAPAAAAPETPGRSISVSPGSAEPTLNPLLAQAYAAFQAGDAGMARQIYSRLAGIEPKNADAWLGLAAIEARQGNTDEAVRHYLQVLELEPRHALAQSGLIALLGRADPLAAETRLKQLIAREPSAYLFFTLGNLYADQSLWAAAQQAYFQAHHLESSNPDYAYNLAVSLEHVSQPRLALGFYRRAVELATAKGRANFSVSQARERVARLTQQVE
jgi:Flp pilus assembly protein TadD